MEVTNVLKLLSDTPKGTFLEFSQFNDRTFGTCDFTGVSPGWEMHPDTDEFFYVLSGCVEITLLQEGGPEHYVAPEGTSFVVPRGIWHKPGAPKGARFIYFTPGQSLFRRARTRGSIRTAAAAMAQRRSGWGPFPSQPRRTLGSKSPAASSRQSPRCGERSQSQDS